MSHQFCSSCGLPRDYHTDKSQYVTGYDGKPCITFKVLKTSHVEESPAAEQVRQALEDLLYDFHNSEMPEFNKRSGWTDDLVSRILALSTPREAQARECWVVFGVPGIPKAVRTEAETMEIPWVKWTHMREVTPNPNEARDG